MRHYFEHLSQKVKQNQEEIDARNLQNLQPLSMAALLASGVIFFLALLLPPYRSFRLPYGAFFAYSILLYLFARRCRGRRLRRGRLIMYCSITPLLLAAILSGTFFDAEHTAVTAVLFLCILPLFLLDEPWRIVLYQVGFSGLFILCSYVAKSPEIFFTDVLYLPFYLLFIVAATIFSLADRIESVENYVQVRGESERDSLTALLNRKNGEQRVSELLRTRTGGIFAILDIDDFKRFNDDYGHQVGDAVLNAVSQSMRSAFRTHDIILRLGGDEFALFLPGLMDEQICRERFAVLAAALDSVYLPDRTLPLHIELSVGCTICADPAHTDFDTIYRQSDAALYQAKNAGKNRVAFYVPA